MLVLVVVVVALVSTPAIAGVAATTVNAGATQATVPARLRNSLRVVSLSAMCTYLLVPEVRELTIQSAAQNTVATA